MCEIVLVKNLTCFLSMFAICRFCWAKQLEVFLKWSWFSNFRCLRKHISVKHNTFFSKFPIFTIVLEEYKLFVLLHCMHAIDSATLSPFTWTASHRTRSPFITHLNLSWVFKRLKNYMFWCRYFSSHFFKPPYLKQKEPWNNWVIINVNTPDTKVHQHLHVRFNKPEALTLTTTTELISFQLIGCSMSVSQLRSCVNAKVVSQCTP